MYCEHCNNTFNNSETYNLIKDNLPEEHLICPNCANIINHHRKPESESESESESEPESEQEKQEKLVEALRELYLNPETTNIREYKHTIGIEIHGISKGNSKDKSVVPNEVLNDWFMKKCKSYNAQFINGYVVLNGKNMVYQCPLLKQNFPLICDGHYHRFFWDLCPFPVHENWGRIICLDETEDWLSVIICVSTLKSDYLRELASKQDYYFVIGDNIYSYPASSRSHSDNSVTLCNRIENAEYYEQLKNSDRSIDLRAIMRV